MSGVESRLPAAHLLRNEVHLSASITQQRLGVAHGVGKEQIAQAGGKQLYAHAAVLGYALFSASAR